MTTVRRFGRAARWFHAGTYISVLVALATGWWFVLDGYRHDSPVARALGTPDATIHELAGYGAAAVFLLWLPFGLRGIGAFVRSLFSFRGGDGRWLASMPKAAFTGRFRYHDGHLDPGQRLATVAMLATLIVVVGSGLWMLWLPTIGVNMLVVHRWATFLLTPVLLGHIVIASGVLPGYRGVWRSIHLGGRLPIEVSRRVWPGWTSRQPND